MDNKLTQKSQTSALTEKGKLKLPRLHQALAQEQARQSSLEELAQSMPNRIALMLDTSGSMAGTEEGGWSTRHNQFAKSKITLLREACQGFLTSCNFGDTSIAIETFPFSERTRFPLSTFEPILTTTVMALDAGGGTTPMAEAMNYVLGSYSLTRGVIVSDGDADYASACESTAHDFKLADVPLDCVHIGKSSSGEELLSAIARITGGLFIKFDNVENFAKNFSYLTPQKRASLFLAGAQQMLGAKEIK